MCSIVGFIARQDSGPDLKRLAKIIRANHERGQDAHGMAWVDARGRFHVYKRPGAFRDNLHVLNAVQSARVVICHLRKTTQGHHKDNINNHPHVCDAGWFIHNGVISNYPQILSEWGLLASTECDSEVLGLLTGKFNESHVIQWKRAIEQVDRTDQLAIMAVYDRPARLVVGRRGKDLTWHKASEGLYFASLGGGFPHGGKEFRDSQVVEYRWTRDKGGRRHCWVGVQPYTPSVRSKWVRKTLEWYDNRNRKPLSEPESALIQTAEQPYLPVKYRMQQIEKELRAAKRARKQADKFKQSGKQRGCIDGVKYRFDKNDMLVVEGNCDGYCSDCDLSDDECPRRGQESLPTAQAVLKSIGQEICPKCGDVVFDTPYQDGSFCTCGYMDEIKRELDDDPSPKEIMLFDPAILDRMKGK